MTEQEWLNCEDPARMITLITKGFDGCIGVPKEKQKPFQYRASDNKLRYWVEACRNQVPSHLRDEWKKIDDLSESVRLWCGTNAWMKECPRSTRANLLREVIGNPFKPIKLPTLMRCRKCSWDGTGPNRKYCEWGSDPDGKYGHDWHQYSPILTWRDGLIPNTAQDIHDNEKWEEMGILADMCEDAGIGEQKCSKCKGRGELSCSKCSGEGCSDYGIIANGPCTAGDPCPDCNGKGLLDNQDLLMHLRGMERCPQWHKHYVSHEQISKPYFEGSWCKDCDKGWIPLRGSKIVKSVPTTLNCPKCDKRGFRRHGAHFDHQFRCGECNISWEPGKDYDKVEEVSPHVKGCHVLEALTGRE